MTGNQFNLGAAVYYPRLQAKGLVTSVLKQTRGVPARYEVDLGKHGVWSISQECLEPFKGQKIDQILGTKKDPISFKSPLEASSLKKAPTGFTPTPQAGIFTPNDLRELRERYETELVVPVVRRRKKKPRVTIANATQRQVQDALHKIAMKNGPKRG